MYISVKFELYGTFCNFLNIGTIYVKFEKHVLFVLAVTHSVNFEQYGDYFC